MSSEPIAVQVHTAGFTENSVPHILQGGQRTSYIRAFLSKTYNGGNCSTICQNKTHLYTILTTNLYDKSQTKVTYRLVW
jgi:tRNA A22 N-methylase